MTTHRPTNDQEVRDRREYHQRTYQELRRSLIAHYGGQCVCCGVADWRFLSFDHRDNDGADHRRSVFGTKRPFGRTWLRWLRDNKPDFIQLLCHNCNMAKAAFGGTCPHVLDSKRNAPS